MTGEHLAGTKGANKMKENVKRSGSVGTLKILALMAALTALVVALVVMWSGGVTHAATPSVERADSTSRAKVAPGPAAPQTCDYVWQTVGSPNGGPANNILKDLVSITANDIWAVGSYVNGNTNATLIEHWNGSSWSVVPSPNVGSSDNELNGVAASASNDIWAVGDEVDTDGVKRNMAEHWNGSNWTVTSTPGSN